MDKNLLDLYTDYLICQNHHATATGLSNLLDGEVSHDKVTRFLNRNNFDSKDLWKYVKKDVRKHEDEEGVLIFDDTIEEKLHTDENNIICWHYSHAKGRYVKGINILSALIRYNDFSMPIAFEAICKDLHFCDVKTGEEKRKSSKTKNELFRSMTKQAVSNCVKFKYVLADNWFGSKENMKFMHYDLRKKFIFGIKSNRLIALSKADRKKGQYFLLSSLNMKDKETKKVYLKDIPFSVKLLKRVFKNENGTTGSLFLITNDLNIDTDQIYSIYQKRWKIEEYHKSIKQNASLEKSPTKVPRSQKNHIFASIISYCKLEFLKNKTTLNHFALKYKLILKANQMAFGELQKIRSSA